MSHARQLVLIIIHALEHNNPKNIFSILVIVHQVFPATPCQMNFKFLRFLFVDHGIMDQVKEP
jgi:hypothetical protein